MSYKEIKSELDLPPIGHRVLVESDNGEVVISQLKTDEDGCPYFLDDDGSVWEISIVTSWAEIPKREI